MKGMQGNFNHVSVVIVWWGGVILLVMGLLKIGIYALGVLKPGLYEGISSVTVKRFFTGKGNRLVFGLGGLITAAVGGFFMVAAKGLELLMEHLSL
ncbi:MAG: hypothetical protein KDM63_03985 [Verrucomicrobiae bacterium]|nr:hypothetical protein [Verrucomicrobiae bacterium]